jgi:hypothetical protein
MIMRAVSLETMSQTEMQWLYFGAMFAALVLAGVGVFVWLRFVPKKRKRKRRHHGHGRTNPTRAEIGGLPPPKEPETLSGASEPPANP